MEANPTSSGKSFIAQADACLSLFDKIDTSIYLPKKGKEQKNS
jgi:hypothetical protein